MFTLSLSGLLSNNDYDLDKYFSEDPTFVTRYRIAGKIIEEYKQQQGSIRKLKVLDVGGYGSILDDFASIDLTILDQIKTKAKIKNYVRGDALNLPFDNNSFDVVVSCDVLEHITDESRKQFIKELTRVSKDLVILAAPFNTEGVRNSETAANNYYKDITGKDHPWLLEHLQNNLPELQRIKLNFDKYDLNTAHFSHTSLEYWQLVTRLGFLYSLEEKQPDFVRKIKDLNRFYLEQISQSDFSNQGYRTFIIASKKNEVEVRVDQHTFDSNLQHLFSIITDSLLLLI